MAAVAVEMAEAAVSVVADSTAAVAASAGGAQVHQADILVGAATEEVQRAAAAQEAMMEVAVDIADTS